jgi:hypothetical protein
MQGMEYNYGMDYKKFIAYVEYAANAHQEHPGKFGKTQRQLPSGEENPYITHPLWCAMMILLEPTLPQKLREEGAAALLFHDLLEDTTQPLPENTPDSVKELVAHMTVPKEAKYNYSSWEKEKREILTMPIHIQLLKLYDKTATLYDLVLSKERYKEWSQIVMKLADTVEKNYGTLRIVTLARALAKEQSYK